MCNSAMQPESNNLTINPKKLTNLSNSVVNVVTTCKRDLSKILVHYFDTPCTQKDCVVETRFLLFHALLNFQGSSIQFI